jgi:hypothetical protein
LLSYPQKTDRYISHCLTLNLNINSFEQQSSVSRLQHCGFPRWLLGSYGEATMQKMLCLIWSTCENDGLLTISLFVDRNPTYPAA